MKPVSGALSVSVVTCAVRVMVVAASSTVMVSSSQLRVTGTWSLSVMVTVAAASPVQQVGEGGVREGEGHLQGLALLVGGVVSDGDGEGAGGPVAGGAATVTLEKSLTAKDSVRETAA